MLSVCWKLIHYRYTKPWLPLCWRWENGASALREPTRKACLTQQKGTYDDSEFFVIKKKPVLSESQSPALKSLGA